MSNGAQTQFFPPFSTPEIFDTHRYLERHFSGVFGFFSDLFRSAFQQGNTEGNAILPGFLQSALEFLKRPLLYQLSYASRTIDSIYHVVGEGQG
jgi:hypothetical protein